jgi:hypothetical protein
LFQSVTSFGTEKAGVGGSTPSLATIIPKDIIRIRSVAASPLSVRIHERH